MEYIMLFVTILITSQWVPIRNNILSVVRKKKPYEVRKNVAISKTIKGKTGIDIKTFKVINDDKPHEAGHYILKHAIKIGLVIAILFLSGIYLLNITNIEVSKGILALPLGFVLGIMSIQYQRKCEYEADAFALQHITNPEGMISATHKFRKAWGNWPPQNGLRRKLFYAGVPYSERIKNAQEEIQKRKLR